MHVTIFRDYKEENWHSMEVYADELLCHLKKRYPDLLRVREYVALPHLSRFFPARHKYIRMGFRYIVNPMGAATVKSDIFHITDHANTQLLAVLDPKKTVVTCHDLTAPYWTMRNLPLSIKRRIRFAVERWRLGFMRNAAKIIAVSNATKDQIMRELGIPARQIVVIPEGVNKTFHRVNDARLCNITKRSLALPKKFLLHVGTTYYNKNIEGLLRGFFSIARQDADIYLVKAGDPWTQEQSNMICASPYGKRVRHIGFVSFEHLPALYTLATALVQPSFAEGFGFTVLEAMACGTPVVVSDIPALKEMVADAGVYISPNMTTTDISNIFHVVKSSRLRSKMRTLGIQRAKYYSWDRTAKETFALYLSISGKQKERS